MLINHNYEYQLSRILYISTTCFFTKMRNDIEFPKNTKFVLNVMPQNKYYLIDGQIHAILYVSSYISDSFYINSFNVIFAS